MHKLQLADAAVYMRALLNTIAEKHNTLEDVQQVAGKITLKMGEHNIEQMSPAQMRAIGSSPWCEENGESLFLIPAYFKDNVAPFMATDINGKKEWFETSTADGDSRFGMLAIGHKWDTNYPESILTTSAQKIAEYKELDISAVTPDVDTPEVMGTPDEVILYKAMQAPENVFVEDTIVVIDGTPIVDWKFTYKDHIVPGKPFVWEVRLAYRKNGYIYSCTERMNLVFTNDTPHSPDFDAYSKLQYTTTIGHPTFKLNKTNERFDAFKEMESDYRTDGPRARAIRKHKHELFDLVVPESIIRPWSGDLQK